MSQFRSRANILTPSGVKQSLLILCCFALSFSGVYMFVGILDIAIIFISTILKFGSFPSLGNQRLNPTIVIVGSLNHARFYTRWDIGSG
uniref:Rap-GAP domain-containing protein n=1 Tax=Parascaris univalens TaxID=6257 RepID=A0A915ATC4_PARUN